MQTIENATKIRRNDELIAASVDGELVMLSVDRGQYFGVSGVGTRIWQWLEEPASPDELVERVCAEFDVDEETCRTEVNEFLAKMLSLELVALQ